MKLADLYFKLKLILFIRARIEIHTNHPTFLHTYTYTHMKQMTKTNENHSTHMEHLKI